MVEEVSSLTLDGGLDAEATIGAGPSSSRAADRHDGGSVPERIKSRPANRIKGDYNLVAAEEAEQAIIDDADDGYDIDQVDENPFASDELPQIGQIGPSAASTTASTVMVILHHVLLPDHKFAVASVRLLDGEFAVKLLKFLLLTLLGIAAMYHTVRRVGWEHDPNLKLSDLYLYEGNLVVLDVTVFFVVGRLHLQRGVDHLAWILILLAANLYASGVTNLKFMQHSLTLYEMHCRWPWQLWVFVGVLIPLVIALVILHVHRSVQKRIFLMKLIELIVTVSAFLIPPLTSNYFHFHHWFAGWLIGMHCNFDVWWSRAAMAWCWGLYINGIAAYGRDPLLTCGYAFWLSTDLRCPYIQCYLDGLLQPQNDTDHPHVTPMIPPNWRNCSSDTYHP